MSFKFLSEETGIFRPIGPLFYPQALLTCPITVVAFKHKVGRCKAQTWSCHRHRRELSYRQESVLVKGSRVVRRNWKSVVVKVVPGAGSWREEERNPFTSSYLVILSFFLFCSQQRHQCELKSSFTLQMKHSLISVVLQLKKPLVSWIMQRLVEGQSDLIRKRKPML